MLRCWLIGLLLVQVSFVMDLQAALPGAGGEPPLIRLVRTHSGDPVEKKLGAVNTWFNRIPFAPDQQNWGQADYWATLGEFLNRGAGDCEDYAIAKYFTLKAMGVAPARLKLLYAYSTTLGQPHMVLLYQGQQADSGIASAQVLDNTQPQIRRLDERTDLVSVYAFNESGIWSARGNRLKYMGEAKRMTLWQGVLAARRPLTRLN